MLVSAMLDFTRALPRAYTRRLVIESSTPALRTIWAQIVVIPGVSVQFNLFERLRRFVALLHCGVCGIVFPPKWSVSSAAARAPGLLSELFQ